MTEIEKNKEFICRQARRFNDRGWLAAADGNISFRTSEQEIWITPTGINKAELKPEEFAQISIDNRVLSGKPSSERLMHVLIYRHCPQAKAVVHAHPPACIAWSIAKPDFKELPAECMSELILAVGQIPIVPYARPGTQAMGDVLVPFLPQSRVMILGRHGALSWGEDLQEAFNGIERAEHSATVLKYACDLGTLSGLPAAEVKALRELRQRMGERTL